MLTSWIHACSIRLGVSSNHTTKSPTCLANWAREWAGLLPCLFTWPKEIQQKFWADSKNARKNNINTGGGLRDTYEHLIKALGIRFANNVPKTHLPRKLNRCLHWFCFSFQSGRGCKDPLTHCCQHIAFSITNHHPYSGTDIFFKHHIYLTSWPYIFKKHVYIYLKCVIMLVPTCPIIINVLHS